MGEGDAVRFRDADNARRGITRILRQLQPSQKDPVTLTSQVSRPCA